MRLQVKTVDQSGTMTKFSATLKGLQEIVKVNGKYHKFFIAIKPENESKLLNDKRVNKLNKYDSVFFIKQKIFNKINENNVQEKIKKIKKKG